VWSWSRVLAYNMAYGPWPGWPSPTASPGQAPGSRLAGWPVASGQRKKAQSAKPHASASALSSQLSTACIFAMAMAPARPYTRANCESKGEGEQGHGRSWEVEVGRRMRTEDCAQCALHTTARPTLRLQLGFSFCSSAAAPPTWPHSRLGKGFDCQSRMGRLRECTMSKGCPII
jgi:hypothetical protein